MYKIESIKLNKINYSIKDIGEDFNENIGVNLQANFNFDINQETKKLTIRSTFKVVEENSPFKLETVLEATIQFEDFPSLHELTRIIHKGGPDILIPYQREVISSITAKSFHTPVFIPYTAEPQETAEREKNFESIKEQLREIFESSQKTED
jgi:preprotein translocase subunit SecB